MTPGIWTPLDRGRRQIRLAHLAPSEKLDEQPSCSLHVASLNENPRYEALSYVWGDPKVTRLIKLRTSHQSSTIHIETDALPNDSHLETENLQLPGTEAVTDGIRSLSLEVPNLPFSADTEVHSAQWPVAANLEVALRYLRHKYVERILWIDAICIDQSNIEERNRQVPLMKAIYSNAEAVRVWLGDPTTGSDDAMAILKELGQKTPLEDVRLQDRLIDDRHLQSVIELMKRPWWERTWVQQELMLAKRAIFHCGFSSLEWSAMLSTSQSNGLMGSAMKSLRFNDLVLDELVDSFDATTRTENMADIYQQGSEATDEDFVWILADGRLCYNSDARDSVYGFLGLMNEHIASKIKPDYNLSIADVFQDAATQLTICSQSLVLFSLTQYTERSDRWIPTWVPSWCTLTEPESREEWGDRVIRLAHHDFFSTCGEHKLKFEIVDRDILKLSGTRLDRVGRKSDVTLSDATLGETLAQHWEWRLLCGPDIDSQSPYIAGGTTNEAYWRTLANDLYVDIGGPRRRCQAKDHKAYLEWLHELESTETVYWESELANSFNSSYRQACIGRRFFVTQKGYFSNGPAELEEGDEIYILAGGKHPFALRPLSTSRSDTYELIGDCYVHGIMDGQAVSDSGTGQESVEDSHCEENDGGQTHDPDLPLRDFYDIFII